MKTKFQVGDRVSHRTYGPGTITAIDDDKRTRASSVFIYKIAFDKPVELEQYMYFSDRSLTFFEKDITVEISNILLEASRKISQLIKDECQFKNIIIWAPQPDGSMTRMDEIEVIASATNKAITNHVREKYNKNVVWTNR